MLRRLLSRVRRQPEINRQLYEGIGGTAAGLDELRTWLHNNNQALEDLAERIAPVETYVSASRAMPDPAGLGLERFEAGTAGRVIGYRSGGPGVAPEEDYVAFEDVFRLSEEIIRERQRPYLRLLGSRQPVLDVGCGRGEFLELLREAEIPARGIDLDAGMVARARAKGLEVEQGDGVELLERLPDRSQGAVFAAQVVEHLPYEGLLAFLRQAFRVLAPGGILIAETVNPHSPSALKNFWFDPTHQHPVFPEVLLTLCRSIGFERAYVFHPGGTGDVDRDRELAGDYALIAER
ncbi:MAG: class I SAM-dependent methyltransferase [Solirubrobacterales bacterium]|nr:class I SAM-dependent methyltransferase [Solirubrobacterales bacterium]